MSLEIRVSSKDSLPKAQLSICGCKEIKHERFRRVWIVVDEASSVAVISQLERVFVAIHAPSVFGVVIAQPAITACEAPTPPFTRVVVRTASSTAAPTGGGRR